MSGTQSNTQWIRKWTVILAAGEDGVDLSQMHIKFEISQSEMGGGGVTPNHCFTRIYNLSDQTMKRIYALSAKSIGLTAAPGPEFARIIIQAGYENGNFGVVFDGTIKQLRNGKETSTDTFLDILASQYDVPYNFSVISRTLAPGVTPQQQAQALADSYSKYMSNPIALNDLSPMTGGVLPRGKVLYGMSREEFWNVGQTTGTKLVLVDGKLNALPFTGYLPGEAVVLNSQTGMVGMPTITQNGMEVQCLLNPKIRIGSRVQINNKDINEAQQLNVAATAEPFHMFASESADGIYRVLVHEMSGDTRGNEWHSKLTCLNIDPSANPNKSVLKYG